MNNLSGFLETKDLIKGSVYHIKNNFSTNLDDLWWNNCTLIDVEKTWANPIILTFKKENGQLIVIDGDFVSKTPRFIKGRYRDYQIIKKPIQL
jgi:hypothetical protein